MKYNRRRRNSGKSVPIEYYLRFTALEDCTFKFVYNSNFDVGLVLYSNDEGKNWIEWPHSKYSIRVKSGDSVIWKQDAENVYADNNGIGHFVTIGRFNISGSIASLIDGKLQHDGLTDKSYAFKGLFEDTSVVNARELVLLYDNVPPHCYEEMFKNCQYLEAAPSIMGITTLSEYCCSYMFYGCTSLTGNGGNVSNNLYLAPYCFSHMFEGCTTMTSAKQIQGYMATNCCEYMFKDCTSLHAADQMNILGLAPYCFLSMYHGSSITSANITTQDKNPATGSYSYMFGACSNLTQANFDLKATTLAPECYMGMFANCDKLEVAPRILTQNFPSEENAKCCASMFSGCEALSSIYCFAEDNITGNSNNFENWVDDVAESGTFYRLSSTNWPTGASGIPNGWEVEDADNLISPLTIESLSDNNTISIGYVTTRFSYSVDNGITWLPASSYSSTPWTIVLNTGDKLLLISDSFLNGKIRSSDTYKVYGNAQSLINSINFINNLGTVVTSKYLRGLFKDSTKLVDASGLIIPKGDQNALCMEMFSGCTSLVAAPKLPHDVLAYNCYNQMFKNCTSLTTAPELPSKTLMTSCYKSMFEGCTKLTTAPVLPVTQLVDNCYEQMFKGCKLLNYIKCLATDISATSCTTNWVQNVAATGTFVQDPDITWSTGVSGIPSGWTVQYGDR